MESFEVVQIKCTHEERIERDLILETFDFSVLSFHYFFGSNYFS